MIVLDRIIGKPGCVRAELESCSEKVLLKRREKTEVNAEDAEISPRPLRAVTQRTLRFENEYPRASRLANLSSVAP